jgi:hypothetical protein
MPDEIIRSYLKDPFLYSADATFCCGCGTHVPWRECCWVETGEDLQTYTDKLRAKKRAGQPTIPPATKPRGCFGVLLAVVLAIGILSVRFLVG